MPEIRVLHISLTKSMGGIATYQKNLLANIDRDKYQLEFISPYPNAKLIPYLTEMGCKVHIVPSEKRVVSYFICLYKVIRNGHFDAVHIHKNSLVNSLPFFAARFAGCKNIIAHAHNTSPTNGKWLMLFHYVFRSLVRKMTTVRLACSLAASDWLFGEKHPAQIVKNGIDLAKFSYDATVRQDVRAELGIESELLVGHVGNFFYQKNHRFMVEIMAEMKKICPDAKLMLVGRGDMMDEIKQYSKQLEVSDNILFLGSRSDVHRLYQAMDVFLLPSFNEGFGIVGLEAQAAGLPYLMSDKVPSETKFTEKCYSMSLSESPLEWAKKICDISKDTDRKNNYELLKQAGYDVRESAKAVEANYAKVIVKKGIIS